MYTSLKGDNSMSNRLRDSFVRDAYYRIRDEKVSEEAIIKAIQLYLRRPLSEHYKMRVHEYSQKIKSGELTFEQYWKIYESRQKDLL